MARNQLLGFAVLALVSITAFQNCGENLDYDAYQTSLASVTAPYAAPVIHSTTGDRSALVGQNVSFAVSASGGGLTYAWVKGNSPIPGANSNLLSLNNVQLSDAGVYSVTVDNGTNPPAVALMQLTVTAPTPAPTPTPAPPVGPNPTPAPTPAPTPPPVTPPVITQGLQSVQLPYGSSWEFSVAASGSNLQYRWYLNNNLISGAIGSSRVASQQGTYRVEVFNSAGTVSSSGSLTFYQDSNPCYGGGGQQVVRPIDGGTIHCY